MPAADQCARCGVRALEGQTFHPETFVIRSVRWYCPNCYARLHRRLHTFMLVAVLALGPAGFILRALNPESHLGGLFVSLFLFQISLAITIVPHEFGHALAARLCGLDVQKVVLGSGPNIFVARILGFHTEFKLLPIAGAVFALPKQVGWLRARWLIFVAAGPSANALAIAAAHLVFGAHALPSLALGTGAANLFILANWCHLVANLVPFVAQTARGRLPNDGLAILQLLFLRRLPFVPEQKPSRSGRLLAWIGALLLWLLALVCLGLAWLVSRDDTTMLSRVKLFLEILFGGMGLSLIWFGRRAISSTTTQARAGSRHPLRVFIDEIQQHARPCLQHPLATEYRERFRAKDWRAAEETLLKILPPDVNAFIAWSAAECREFMGDHAGAAEMLAVADRQVSPAAAVWTKIRLIAMKLRIGDVEAATDLSRTLVERLHGAERLFVLDHLACLPIMENLKSFLPTADLLSREALELQPQNLTIKGTRGSILVELGRIDEGEPLLSEVYSTSEADNDKGISAFYLGLIAKARGDLDRSKMFAAKAVLLYPEKWLKDRTNKERCARGRAMLPPVKSKSVKNFLLRM